MTTDLLSRGGKDIAFASYSPLWKFQRKLVHAALSMFGEGSVALEKISKCPPPPRYHICVCFLSLLHLLPLCSIPAAQTPAGGASCHPLGHPWGSPSSLLPLLPPPKKKSLPGGCIPV